MFVLNASQPNQDFPSPNTASTDPNGLLAVGGCLSSQRLINAYKCGIFPWYSLGEPILWWSPNPRLVLFPAHLKISRSLKKTIRQQPFVITYNRAFSNVLQQCATPRDETSGTWITDAMRQAYTHLHQQGISHSFEAWASDELVGGLYGVAIGQVFFGESMFHRQTNASKVAFYHCIQQLTAWGYRLIDCQVHTPHLISLGARQINREVFTHLLSRYCPRMPHKNAWQIS